MVIEIEFSALEKWRKNFTETMDNKDVPFFTCSADIGFNGDEKVRPKGKDLLKFLSKLIELNADGFRLYFIRYDTGKKALGRYPGKGEQPTIVGKGLTQVSFAMVPTKNEGMEIVKSDDNKDTVLIPGGEHTGLCPTNCPTT